MNTMDGHIFIFILYRFSCVMFCNFRIQHINKLSFCIGSEGGFSSLLLTYLQFSVIKWAKQRPGQNPIDVKSNEAIQI
jgi:hypothetical protein